MRAEQCNARRALLGSRLHTAAFPISAGLLFRPVQCHHATQQHLSRLVQEYHSTLVWLFLASCLLVFVALHYFSHQGAAVAGSLCESFVHSRYIWVKKIGVRTDPSVGRSRGCANAAPAAMPPSSEAREGCSGLVGEACARQLDGGVDGRRPPYPQR